MRKRRAGEINRKTLEAVIDKFENDWDRILVIEFHNELLPASKRLIEKYPLRGPMPCTLHPPYGWRRL